MTSNESDNAVNVRCKLAAEQVLPGFSKEVRRDVALVVHDDCHVANVARFADAPYRNAGTVKLLTLDDFKAFVTGRAGGAPTYIFVHHHEVRAVFNMASWQDDVAVFPLTHTPEWLAWTQRDESSFRQDAFCDFLEDHLKEIKEPCGAELLELVSDFRQMTHVEYGSSYRGSDGQVMLEYKERKEGAGGREMALPAEFVLHLPVIKGAEAMTTYEVKARLRVRVDNETRKLSLQYKLVRPDIPADNAITDMVAHLREAMPGAAVYAGVIDKAPGSIIC